MTVPRKEPFDLAEGSIELDGEPLGPLPKVSATRATQVIKSKSGAELNRAWNSLDWMSLLKRAGNRSPALIGAPEGSVASADRLYVEKAGIIATTEIIEDVINIKYGGI